MALPAAMQRDAEEADQFLDNLSNPSDPTLETPPEGVETPSAPTPEAPPAGSDVDTLRAENQRLLALLADENSPTYRHRYEVLVGKYNAEIPRLIEKVKELEARLTDKPEAQAPAQRPEYDDAYNDLVDEHGPTTAKNLITIAQSIAQEMIAAERERIDAELQERLQPYDQRVEQLAQSQAVTAQQRFFQTLDAMVPDWKQINGWRPEGIGQDPKFSKFLDQTVPGGEFTYNDLMLEHYKRGNAAKVKEIFDIFKAGNMAAATATPPSKAVEQHIDPSKTGRGSTPPDPTQQKKTYSQAEVNAFFDSITKRTFRGTREEAMAKEQEYTQAMLEGRVR